MSTLRTLYLLASEFRIGNYYNFCCPNLAYLELTVHVRVSKEDISEEVWHGLDDFTDPETGTEFTIHSSDQDDQDFWAGFGITVKGADLPLGLDYLESHIGGMRDMLTHGVNSAK